MQMMELTGEIADGAMIGSFATPSGVAYAKSHIEKGLKAAGRTYELDQPFFVLATQNPIELEGTYPLPEAQLDRFMFHIVIDHPPEEEELQVVKTTTAILEPVFERGRIYR